MTVGADEVTGEVVGRESELRLLRSFVGSGGGRQSLVLSGRPGVGKTTLWQAGLDVAQRLGMCVLSARPSSTEAQLSFVAIADLLDGVAPDLIGTLAPPQRRALEVALLHVEPAAEPPGWRSIATGFLNVLRGLAEQRALLVAVDDAQWLDRPSADALMFAGRRLRGQRVRFLLSTRPGGAEDLERALGRVGIERLGVGALSLGALRRLLSVRLGLTLPRYVMRRVFESTMGNPLFALEVGRMLLEQGLPGIGEELPVPDSVETLLGIRVARLAAPVRRLLFAISLSGELQRSQAVALANPDVLADGVDAGVIVIDGDRVRASHPLLAAATASRSQVGERRRLYRDLADVVNDEELRVRHLALAAEHPDSALAATLAEAAERATARGAAHDAVRLSEHALRATPLDDPGRAERLLALADCLNVAGESQRLTDMLTPQLDSLPGSGARVRAHLLLADGGAVKTFHEYDAHLQQAFVEADGDSVLRAPILARRSEVMAIARVARIADAEAWAREALASAQATDSDLAELARASLGWALSLRGDPIDGLERRAPAFGEASSELSRSLDRVAAVRLTWRGELGEARTLLRRLGSLADERGEMYSYVVARLHLCELELRAGEWQAASAVIDEWDESADRDELVDGDYERAKALLATGMGLPEDADRWAALAIEAADATGILWNRLEGLRARGIAALLVGRVELAVESLRSVWEHAAREGVDDPGAFPVAPDLVEALTELGELDEAAGVTGRLRELAERQQHPWGLATASRCRAIVELSGGGDDAAPARELARAASEYQRLGLRFDHARTLLAMGRAQRRLKKWGHARRSLQASVAAFDALGSAGWVAQARSELARVGARRPSAAGELTATERTVADLAAAGRSNREIAQALHITIKTVEAHLSHTYAKLGVRSRAQLAGRMAGARHG